MANPPPPYSDITGISRAAMKDNAQETIVNYNGNARPGELVVDLTVDPPVLYIGNNIGELTAVVSGTGGISNAFATISVSGQSDVIAVGEDAVTFAAGTGIGIATNASTNTVTITNTGAEVVYNGGSVTGNVTPNLNNGSIQKYTLTGNIDLYPATNMLSGQSMTLILTQDGSGNRLLNANVAYLFASGFQTLSTASGAIDMINLFYDGTTYYATLTVGYA